MPVVIALLRGINVGGHHQIKMEVLRAVCESVGLCNPQTYVQSGNVVFTTKQRDLEKLSSHIATAIEKKVGFRPEVILRTTEEIGAVVANNPFSRRKDVEGSKLGITFLARPLSDAERDQIRAIKGHPEEIHVHDRELYIYFPDGMGRSKLVPVLTRALKSSGTVRNWNTTTKLLEMAKKMDAVL